MVTTLEEKITIIETALNTPAPSWIPCHVFTSRGTGQYRTMTPEFAIALMDERGEVDPGKLDEFEREYQDVLVLLLWDAERGKLAFRDNDDIKKTVPLDFYEQARRDPYFVEFFYEKAAKMISSRNRRKRLFRILNPRKWKP